MDPATWMAIASLAGSAISAASGGSDQPLHSFAGQGDLAPSRMLMQGRNMISTYLPSLVERAAAPQGIETKAQTPLGFTGNSLPFSIGLTGRDAGMTPKVGLNRRQLPQSVATPPAYNLPPSPGGYTSKVQAALQLLGVR